MGGMSEGVPESAPETLVEELLRSTGLLMRRLRAKANPDDLTLSQVAVIARLERGGPATTADLARAEGVKPQSMGATLTALEGEGLVARAAHPTDGRQFLYQLTEAGVEARERRLLLKRAWLTSALTRLDDQEKESLRTALQVIRRLGES
jgi:DNA-binding MarR family transcriptional regulator